MPEKRRWGAARAGMATGLAVLYGAPGCGGLASDRPGDADDNGSEWLDEGDAVEVAPVPGLPSSPSQAALSLRFGAQSGRCASPFDFMLPDWRAREIVESGRGPRAIDGRDGDIRCRVAPLSRADRTFALELIYGGVPTGDLSVSGEISAGSATGRVTLRVSLPPSEAVEAECRAVVQEVGSDAIELLATDCTSVTYAGAPVDCDIELAALFENCSE
jgi:hypothetical protein